MRFEKGNMKWLCIVGLTSILAWAEPLNFEGYVSCEGRGWQVLRTQQDYDDFVTRVPTVVLQKRQPAPASEDPLLQRPAVDFEQNFLLAIWSHNVHVDAKVLNAQRSGADLEVDLAFGAPSNYQAYAAPYGYGQYHLVAVPIFSGELKIKSIQKKAP